MRIFSLSYLSLCIIGLLLSVISLAQGAAHLPLNKAQKDSLKNEIETMMTNDQKYRWMIMYGELDAQKIEAIKNGDDAQKFQRMSDVRKNKAGISQHQKDSLAILQEQIDSLNFIKVCCIINTFGFPKKYVEASTVSVLLLHKCELISDDFLKLLMDEVKTGNMPGLEYAIIYDRIRMESKQPELYYVSEHYNAATKTSAIGTPKNLEETNKARAEIGLKKIKG